MIEINLLPVREERRKADMQQQALLLGATLLVSLGVVLVVHFFLNARLDKTNARIVQLDKQIAAFGPQLQKVEAFQKQKAEVEKKLGVIDRLEKSRSGPVHLLDELATHTPERLWLTRLANEQGKLVIEGMSLDNELVALFLTALSGSPYFRQVELEETELLERDGLKLNKFRLNARLTTPGVPETTTAALSAPIGVGR